MYSIKKLKELMFLGAPILIDNGEPICMVHPLSVKDKIMMDVNYQKYLSLLTLSEEEVEDIIIAKIGELEYRNMEKVTPFEYLLTNAQYNSMFLLDLKEAFSTFIKEEVIIIPHLNKIMIGDPSQERFIDEEIFKEIQNVLRIQNKLEIPEEIPENENPMAKKFRLRRKAVKEAKARKAAKDVNAPEFIDLMSSLCCANIGITWNNIGDLPIFTFYELLHRTQKKERYELDIQSLLAGADSKKVKPQYWISKESD